MDKVNVFVSSTCYDLSEIRKELKQFISDSGYNPILSEFKEFPVNPSKDTIENCVEAVRNDADIYILIIGRRYGNATPSGKSITNLEYLASQEKKIPTYIFVDKSVKNIYREWKKNKEGDFSEHIESTKICEFIESITDREKRWIYDFEKSVEIIDILHIHWSKLFKASLKDSLRLSKIVEEDYLQHLSGEALKILLYREEHFEIEFFFKAIIDELEKLSILKNDHEYEISLTSKYTYYSNQKLIDWIRQRFEILNNLTLSLKSLIHNAFPKYFADPGIPSDIRGIYYVATTYARIIKSALIWVDETKTTCVTGECTKLRHALSKLADNLIEQMWNFPFEQMKIVQNFKENPSNSDCKTVRMTLSINFDEEILQEYEEEFNKYHQLVLEEIREFGRNRY